MCAMPRKSTFAHELEGTTSQAVLPDSDIPAGRPKCPKGISGEAKKTFLRLTKMLAQRRTLTAGDAELLRLYAYTYDRHARALEHLASEGEVIMEERQTKNGEHTYLVQKESLWLSIATQADKFLRGCLADLGLNPINRAKVKTTEKPKSDNDDLPAKEDVLLPEPEEVDLNAIYEQYATPEMTTESDEAQRLRAEAEIEKIMAEDD